jgi:hypothetical protein
MIHSGKSRASTQIPAVLPVKKKGNLATVASRSSSLSESPSAAASIALDMSVLFGGFAAPCGFVVKDVAEGEFSDNVIASLECKSVAASPAEGLQISDKLLQGRGEKTITGIASVSEPEDRHRAA